MNQRNHIGQTHPGVHDCLDFLVLLLPHFVRHRADESHYRKDENSSAVDVADSGHAVKEVEVVSEGRAEVEDGNPGQVQLKQTLVDCLGDRVEPVVDARGQQAEDHAANVDQEWVRLQIDALS